MGIKDIFNSVNNGVGKINDTLSDVFGQTVRVQNPVAQQKMVNPTQIPTALHYLESTYGTDPNTPRNQVRTMVIPAANKNEKPRTVHYQIGYGGEFGLTPLALAQLAKSQVNKSAPPEQYTKQGPPLTPGLSPNDIQRQLLTREGASQLATQYFNKRPNANNFTPEVLANDYIEHYVGKGTPGDTPQNRQRVLNYFRSLAK